MEKEIKLQYTLDQFVHVFTIQGNINALNLIMTAIVLLESHICQHQHFRES